MTPVEFHFIAPDGAPIANTEFEIQLSAAAYHESQVGVIMPRLVTATTDDQGEVTVALQPSTSMYFLLIEDPLSEAVITYQFYVPALTPPNTTVRLQDIVVSGPVSDTNYDENAIRVIVEAKAAAIQAQIAAKASEEAAAESASILLTETGLATAAHVGAVAAKDIAVTKASEASDSATDAAQSAATATIKATQTVEDASTASEAATTATAKAEIAVSASEVAINKADVATEAAEEAGNSADAASMSEAMALAARPVTSATPPVNPLPNTEWIDSATGRHYTWLTDEGAWVEVYAAQVVDNPARVSTLETALNAENGAEKVGFKQSGSNTKLRKVNDKLREVMSAFDYIEDPAERLAITLGTSNNDHTAIIQAMINSIPRGEVVINPGYWNVTDITIKSKAAAAFGPAGGFTIKASGAIFVGTGRIIIDSCKRTVIVGLDAPKHDLLWRGAWWCEFIGMRFRNLIMGDANGTGFSSTSWNTIRGGQSQAAILHVNATSYYNEVTWDCHSMRGDPSQGFSSTAAYAFEFNGNANAQSWKFLNGDISYHTAAIYSIGPNNINTDIELAMTGVYLDAKVPMPTARNGVRITTDRCHHANGTVYVATLAESTCGPVDMFRADRSMRHDSSMGVNLIPNGDLKDLLTVWAGTGLPIAAANGATITPMSGGLSGNYLNIHQPLTANNIIRFRPKALPHAGRITGTLVLRNADPGSKPLTLSIAGLTPPFTITNEWTVIRLAASELKAAGAVHDVSIYTNDGTPFNVDVAYACLSMGEGTSLLVPATGFRTIEYSEAFDFGSIPVGGQAYKDFTVPGAVLGDFVLGSANNTLATLQKSVDVISANTVRILLQNNHTSAIDLPNTTFYIRVWKRAYV